MTEGTLTVRERDLMYRLMISQMLHDGYHEIANHLSRAISAVPDCPPSNRLQHVVQLGLRAEPDRDTQMTVDSVAPGTGIDLEFDTDVQTLAPEAAHYETCYVTSHKAPCRVAAWSKDGQLVATGSDDASIKILDVERMLAKSATNVNIPDSHTNVESHPVIRTLYDHIKGKMGTCEDRDVTALDFHPSLPLLASGSKDFTIKFFDFSKSGVKRAFRSLQEAEEITCLNFHPSGNFLLVGTQHPTLRLYDITTLQCFVSSNPKDQHIGPLTTVTYSPNGTIYATGSQDGSIKIWDGVSNRCVNTLEKAHSGTDICSIRFSRNSKYLLSSGKDSLVKLWEVSASRTLITCTGASTEKQQHETRAVFNHTEDYVLFPDEKTTSLCCWDSRNAERNKLLSLGHNNIVRCIVHSPTSPGFMTCSDDFRARFWYYRPSSD